MAEMDSVVLGDVQFKRDQNDVVPLDEIDALTFSEVMCDLDLVVSVACASEIEHKWSSEVIESRAELVRNLISTIGLNNVECGDGYACIEGVLGNSRVNLGSGIAHHGRGYHICIIPGQNAWQRDDEFIFRFLMQTALRVLSSVSY